MVWAAGAAAGISVLLTASRAAYTIMKIAGALYLAYLGARMLLDAFRKKTTAVTAKPVPTRSFLQGFTTNLLNPKVGVFYAAMLPQFLPADVAALPLGVLLALVHDLEAMIWFGLIIGGVDLTRRWWTGDSKAAARLRRGLDAVTGTVLIGLGIRLASVD